MRQTLRRYGVAESAELPDHLSHILPALARMESNEAARFAEEFLQPALKKIISALNGNPYQDLLRGVESALTPVREAGVGA
jgi:nitrate reductase assembly molybdenum cofactor insertion protein NarJ